MPGWAPSLLAIALILPVLVASIDAFARARRRDEPVAAVAGVGGSGRARGRDRPVLARACSP